MIDEQPVVSPPPLPAAPEEKKAWGFWWTVLWGVLALLIWVTCQTLGLIPAIVSAVMSSKGGKLDPEAITKSVNDGDALALATLVAAIGACPACWLFGRLKKNWSGWDYLGKNLGSWKEWLFWLGLLVVMLIAFEKLSPFFGIDTMPESMKEMAETTDSNVLLFLGLAVGAPFAEEFIFRGLIFRGWRESRLGLWGTLIMTSLPWALLHIQYSPAIIVWIFLLGIVLGLAREKTGGIWIPVGMHAFNNAAAAIGMIYTM